MSGSPFRGAPRTAGTFKTCATASALAPSYTTTYAVAAGSMTICSCATATPRGADQELKRSYCDSIRANAPLEGEFHFHRGVFSWRFGPYSNGSWRFVMGDGLQAFDVPRDDAFQIGDAPGIGFKIRYTSLEGWVTYSPEITLDFVQHPDSVWHR